MLKDSQPTENKGKKERKKERKKEKDGKASPSLGRYHPANPSAVSTGRHLHYSQTVNQQKSFVLP
jgi:hypothetical protein